DEAVRSEAELIQHYLAPLTDDHDGALELRDDCAYLAPDAGFDLVLTTDSMVEGRHFLPGDVPGFKALAVNISDLIAKGAEPVGYLLTLGLAALPTRKFLIKLTTGLGAAQMAFGCRLLGGDTDVTGGPFTITIAALGRLPSGTMVRRNGARPGDIVYVTGTIGDATLGLRLRQSPELAKAWGLETAAAVALVGRFDMPRPPVAAAQPLRAHASAAMDVSDGLAKDFLTLCRASGVGGTLRLDAVPLSGPARRVIGGGGVAVAELISGGEDYEVLATVRAEKAQSFEAALAAAGVRATAIGSIDAGEGCRFVGTDGAPVRLEAVGWDHLDGR
ncbi:MAG: thiamine-phosphate kinase, partial [Hyphomicrobiaceae bacterium]